MKLKGKRLGALLLALVMVLSLVPTTALAARVRNDEVAIDAPEVVINEATPIAVADAPAVLAEGEEQPTVTQYPRHTGPIEEGIYTIFIDVSPNRYLHNSNNATNQCTASLSGDQLPPGTDSGHPDYNHLWKIAGNPTDGYTIQGVDGANSQNYLTTTVSSSQLKLGSESEAVKLTFTPSGNGYKISPVSDGTKYLGFGSGWQFSTTETVIQIFKQTVIPVTIASATDSSRDVGVTDGTYSNTDQAVVHAWASSQHGCADSNGTDGPATWAVDNNTNSIWHSCYDGGTGTENTDTETTSKVGWCQDGLSASVENRWIELDIKENEGAAQWLSGLRYKGRSNSNGGTVTSCEIRVWDKDAEAWATVTSNTAWTMEGANHGEWKYKEFDTPVLTNKVRLYGVTTDCSNNQFMVASDMRLVKALTQTAPATQDVTVTVRDSDNNLVQGATVSGGGKAATTDENGQATLALADGKTYTLTVSKAGLKAKTVSVTVDGEAVTAQVKLVAPVDANVATYDYPLTDTMVSAVSAHDNDGSNSDGHAEWAIDYVNHWWHQFYNRSEDVWFAFALPAEVAIAGIRYQQREQSDGSFGNYEIQTSTDGTTWTTLAGETGTWGNDHVIHAHTLEEPQTARYFRVHRTNGNAQNRTAKLFQLVLAPEGRTTVTGTVKKDNQPVSGVTVKVYQGETATYKQVTTGEDGSYSIVLPRDGQSWKLVAESMGNQPANYTLTTSAATDTHDFELQTRTLHLTGTAPEGTTVQLMQGAGRTPVADIAARTGTSFDFDVSNLAAGTYYVRAWKDGCVPAWKAVTWTATTVSLDAVTVADSDLVAVDTSSAYKSYDFSNSTQVSEFGSLYGAASGTAAHDSENEAMTLTFSGNGNGSMWANAVGSKDYVLKNGTISFDVTQTAGDVNGRFGLVFRQFNGDGEEAWAFIGEMDSASRYFAENAKVGGGDSGYSGGADGPAMGVGVTRHFEVTVDGANLALKIDGLAVTNWNSNAATAGYWGFTQNKQNTSYRIDNLVVTRADAKNTVSWTAGDGETLTAAIVTPDTTTGTALASGGNAFAGDTIKITGTKTDAILNAVTVNGSADGVTKTAVEGGGYTFTFTMPAQAATVAGTFVPNIPAFTVSGPDASGNISAGTVTETGFTGNTLAITGDLASDTDATFEWYKKTGDSAWAKIDSATGSSYTIKQGDYNSSTTTKLKVKVTGNGTHHAGWKESGEFTVTAPAYAVTGVSLERDTLTMWTNHTPTTSGDFPTEVGRTATLTATVAPNNVTGAEITWTSDNTSAVTVAQSSTNPKEATLTAAGKGTANVKVSVTAGGVTKTATCEVTVKTKVESITVKNGETAVTESAPAKVYINTAGIPDAPKFITLVGTVTPNTANDKGLLWSLAEGSATGKINIQPVGGSDEDPNSAESSGNGVTITAVGTSGLNVGEVTVEVAAHDGLGAKTTFKVQVRRKLASAVSIDVQGGGAPKFGKTLVANISSFGMSDTDKETLSYQWKRTKGGTTEDIGTATVGNAGKTYTLVEADIGATISVVVTANSTTTYYDGSVTSAATAVVAKADAPATPALTPNKPSQEGASDGYISISNYDSTQTYQIKGGSYTDWTDFTFTTAGQIDGLSAGAYSVKVKETNTRKESAEATTIIVAGDAVEYTISYTQPDEGATISGSTKSVAGVPVIINLNVTDGYEVTAVKVNDSADGVTKGTGNTWTFTMPEEDVTVTAEVSKKQVTITLVLSNVTATCDADVEHTGNDTHTVDYGTVETITLTPASGYDLPDEITVTGKDLDSDVWDYSPSSGKITFTDGVTENITITVTADKKTYTVELNATGGRLDLSDDENGVEHGAAFSGTLSVKTANQAQYALPETLTKVTMGGTELTAGTGYTYNKDSGAISIPNVTGNVVITATAEAKKTQLTGVTIEILHNDDTGMGSSNQNVPHVGDTLTAKAAPTGASVTYQWFVGDSTTSAGSAQTYVVKDGDTGTIKVVVTGTGTFEGTKEAVTAAVGEKTWRVTGVSLKTTTSLEFQGEETLTATVEPSTATNKKVTWSSNNTSVATVDANGKVTAVGVGTATITVTTEDGEQTATCEVTVTAKELPQLKITKPQVDQTASVSFTGGVATDVATYEWYTGESTDAENGTWNRVADVSGASWVVTGVPSGRYIKVIANAKSTGNYTGSSTVVSDAILSNEEEVTKYAITTTKTGDGTVTVKVNDTEGDQAAEGDIVTVEVTDVVTGATVAVTSEDVTLTKGTGNIWTFTMPAKEVAITVTITEPVVEKYAITVNAAANGTVTANKTEAAEGATVTLTVTPASGYKLDTLTVTGDSGAVTVTNNTFAMPGEAVTVTATFVMDTSALDKAIEDAEAAKKNVQIKPEDTDPSTVSKGTKYVTQDVMDALDAAIEAAKDADTTDAEAVAEAADTLNAAVEAFKAELKTGTKQTSSNRPSSSTSTVTNPDGSTTTTTTQPDGTKVATTEKPDGTKETVETKKDGTVIETTEKPDGTKETVKTQPDGTVMEIVVAPDGTKESVETKPDGTVTETVIDTEGAVTEKVTDPEENVVITVTDAEGEELAKVELPAKIPASDTTFVDTDTHWAKESIDKMAALKLVEGVGDNQYKPTDSMTRGALATVLHRLSNGKTDYESVFTDVDKKDWYAAGVSWAAKVNVVKGVSKDMFAPDDIITREQLATMLCRYAKLVGMNTTADTNVLNAFTDGSTTGPWAVDSVAWCVKVGILQGRGNDILDPTTHVNRAEVAVMLDRFIELLK